MFANCLSRGWLVAAALVPGVLTAAQGDEGVARLGKPDPKCETVELFSAIESGKIEARLIPRDAKHCRVLVENKTDQPLNVQFPAAFAGVPVMAQFLPPNPANGQQPPQNSPQTQQIGGPFPNPQLNPLMNQGNQGNQGPMFNPRGNGPVFNVSPEKIGEMRLTTVCLDHGKPEPKAKIAYQLKPIDEVTDKPGVRELCCLMGRSDINHQSAQAAAWHLNNAKTWDELRDMKTSSLVPVTPMFTREELEAGKKLSEEALRLAKEPEKSSLSQSDRR
jgi:hypothetical protein